MLYPQPKETIVDAHFSAPAAEILDLLSLNALSIPASRVYTLGGFSMLEDGRVFVDSAFEREVPIPGTASRLSVYADAYNGVALGLTASAGGRSVELAPVNVPASGMPASLLVNPLVPEGLLGENWLAGDKLTLSVTRPTYLILCWS